MRSAHSPVPPRSAHPGRYFPATGRSIHAHAATEWYPVFAALVNLVFLMGLIGIVALGAVKKNEYGLPQLLGVALLFWVLNCGFSIFASPIVLRYQTFPMLVFLPLGLLMVEKIWKMA